MPILKLEDVVNGGFLFLEEKREKKREKMKRKAKGRREKWPATMVGLTSSCFPTFLCFD